MMKKIIIYTVFVFLLAGCEDYLSKIPSMGTNNPVQSVEQLEGLLNNATSYAQEANIFEAYGSDDCGLSRDIYKDYPNNFNVIYCQHLVHYMGDIIAQAADAYWDALYKSIYTANLIIENADKVTGDQGTKDRVKADAHFLRAYVYWLLVNYYAAPYAEENLDKPGVPLKLATSFEEAYKRVSIREVYAQIESDITEASKISVTNVDPKLPWRGSKAAISAFLVRYYLFQGNYAKALTNATEALNKGPVLKDYNTLVAGASAKYANPDVTLEYCETNDQATSVLLFWPEYYYARYTYLGTQWRLPSESLLQTYDQDNDLRFKWFFVEDGDRRFSVIKHAYRYSQFSDGRYCISGLSLAELLLNKAEAEVRTGSWQQGINTLNILREKRIKSDAYTPFTATNQSDALKKVLEERRREFPFVMRLLDIRRYAYNETVEDDVTLIVDFYETGPGKVDVSKPKTYTIAPKSSLFVWPINGIEVNSSQGKILQNEY